MMITFDAEEESTSTAFCDVYPERDREIAEVSLGLYVEIYRREYDKEMCLNNYVRVY